MYFPFSKILYIHTHTHTHTHTHPFPPASLEQFLRAISEKVFMLFPKLCFPGLYLVIIFFRLGFMCEFIIAIPSLTFVKSL